MTSTTPPTQAKQPSQSNTNTTDTNADAQSATRSAPDLFASAVANLPPADQTKPLVFTNLLRFRSVTDYTISSRPPSIDSDPVPCSGHEAYFERYFPIYHRACRDTLGDDSEVLQRVLYKGAPLMPLRLSSNSSTVAGTGTGTTERNYWHAVVVTRCESWAVAERIGQHTEYKEVAGWHRAAAVEDDELYVSCPVDGFEMKQ